MQTDSNWMFDVSLLIGNILISIRIFFAAANIKFKSQRSWTRTLVRTKKYILRDNARRVSFAINFLTGEKINILFKFV